MTTLTDNPALHYAEEYADHSLCGKSLDGGDVAYTRNVSNPLVVSEVTCLHCLREMKRRLKAKRHRITRDLRAVADHLARVEGTKMPADNETPEYGQGYAHGKDKAHFEVRHIAGANHARDCGCEPCITARAVLRGRVYPDRASHDHCIFEAAKWAATMVFHAHGYSTGQQRVDAGIDVGGLTADCVQAAGADVGKAAGLGVAAAFRMLENLRAQADGTADALGLDPTGRLRSWAGRYDGADGEDGSQ